VSWPEFRDRVRREMEQQGALRAGEPLDGRTVAELRRLYAGAVRAYKAGAGEAVDEYLARAEGAARNPGAGEADDWRTLAAALTAGKVSRERLTEAYADDFRMVERFPDQSRYAERQAGRVKAIAASGVEPLPRVAVYQDGRLRFVLDPHDRRAMRSLVEAKSQHEAKGHSVEKTTMPYGWVRYDIRTTGARAGAGTRSNPVDWVTLAAIGVVAGAVQGLVEPYVTRHVYGGSVQPVGTRANPAMLGRARALQTVRELRAKGYRAALGKRYHVAGTVPSYEIDTDAPQELLSRTMWRLSASYRSDRVPDTEEEFDRRFPVENPASRHRGYYHRRVVTDKGAPILPFEDWIVDRVAAERAARELAQERGYPVEVYWADLMTGELSKVFGVRPRTNPRRERLSDQYLNEPISFGGVIVPRGEAALALREQGLPDTALNYFVWGRPRSGLPLWSVSGHVVGKEEALRLIRQS
jgi:hypothetical protein